MEVNELLEGPGHTRVSQRQPLACTSCTKSKVRCDKQMPCSRCRKRGHDCTREKVAVVSKRGAASKARKTSSVSSVTKRDDVPGFREYCGGSEQYCALKGAFKGSPEETSPQVPGEIRNTTGNFEDIATAIEGLAWGRHQCHNYPHKHCRKVQNNGLSISHTVPPGLLAALPANLAAWQLVRHHLDYLAWYHGVLHAPTFLKQCEQFWTSAEIDHPQWLGLYCAVLAAASWSLENSQTAAPECSTANLLSLAVDVLYKENFLESHSIFAVQAVCVLEMVAHVQGRSDLFTVLVNSCIRIGQCLGLHHIPNDLSTGDLWEDRVDKEVGRRAWSKLNELDCHLMPYAGTISLNPKNASTSRPSNRNDDDLVDQPSNVLTSSTCSLVMSKIASLMPALLDGMCNLTDVRLQYQRVIDSDREMRALVSTFPTVLLRRLDPKDEPPICWLTAARRTLAISAADKVIMIHRPFLLKSFESPMFLFTRNTCVSAALTILRVHEELHVTAPGCAIWVHSAFCVTAIVVLCLNVLYLSTASFPSEAATIQKQLTLVHKARMRLSRQKSDLMASRGVHIVDAMLGDGIVSAESLRNRVDSRGRPDFELILDRFLALDNSTIAPASSADGMVETFEADGLLEEFDMWYASVFGS